MTIQNTQNTQNIQDLYTKAVNLVKRYSDPESRRESPALRSQLSDAFEDWIEACETEIKTVFPHVVWKHVRQDPRLGDPLVRFSSCRSARWDGYGDADGFDSIRISYVDHCWELFNPCDRQWAHHADLSEVQSQINAVVTKALDEARMRVAQLSSLQKAVAGDPE